MEKNIIVDSGFWIALFTKNDANHDIACVIEEETKNDCLLLPYPTMYEFVNTQLTRNENRVINFKRFLKSTRIQFIDDKEYRDDALNLVLSSNRHYSMVDQVIRLMLDDVHLKIDALAGFNYGDFRDICYKRNIEIL